MWLLLACAVRYFAYKVRMLTGFNAHYIRRIVKTAYRALNDATSTDTLTIKQLRASHYVQCIMLRMVTNDWSPDMAERVIDALLAVSHGQQPDNIIFAINVVHDEHLTESMEVPWW